MGGGGGGMKENGGVKETRGGEGLKEEKIN